MLVKFVKVFRFVKFVFVQMFVDLLVDIMFFGVDVLFVVVVVFGSIEDGDVVLFGLLWLLGEFVKLDLIIDCCVLCVQIVCLGELGYVLDFKMQEWSCQVEL